MDEFVGEDLDKNFKDYSGSNPTPHKMEVVDSSLTSPNKIMEANGQVPPAWGAIKGRPKEPAYPPQDETDDLILSVPQSDPDRLYDLPMETLLITVSNETRPDLANTTSERDIADTETTLSVPVLEANEIYEPAEGNTAARCHPNRGRTSRKQ